MKVYIDDLTYIPNVLSSIKQSIEGEAGYDMFSKGVFWGDFKKIVLQIEDMRMSFIPFTKKGYFNEADIDVGVLDLIAGLQHLLNSHEFRQISDCPFRVNTIFRRSRFVANFVNELGPAASVGGAAKFLCQSLEALNLKNSEVFSEVDPEIDVEEIKRILPPQKIAPVQFDIENGRIVLLRRGNEIEKEDENGIKLGKEALAQQGIILIDMLKQSNCDRRIVENIERLNRQILEGENIVMIGLSNLTCETIRSNSESELSDVVNSMFHAHTRGIDMYLSQYPEWNKFLENVSSSHLGADDIKSIKKSAEFVIEKLEKDKNISDPEVPETLKYISEMLSRPGVSSKRAAFAVMRSIENFVSRAYLMGIDLMEQTTKKSIESCSSAISKAVAVSILTIALGAAAQISPASLKIDEMAWLKSASEIVRKQIEKLAD